MIPIKSIKMLPTNDKNADSFLLRLYNWLKFPKNILPHILIVLPLIFSQLCQRVFHIIDNRFIAQLGSDVLYIHNLQYTLIVFGQFIGLAGTTAGLVFWKRQETQGKRGGLLIQLITSTAAVCLILVTVFIFLLPKILTTLKVSPEYYNLAVIYIKIGLLNMSLYALYMCFDGLLIASGRQQWSFILALILGVCNFFADYGSIHFLFARKVISTTSVAPAFITIGASTSILLVLIIFIAIIVIRKRIDGWGWVGLKDFTHVYGSELGLAMIRSVSPMIYPLQFVAIQASADFINTYNTALHIAFLCCLPLTAGVQIAVREASASESTGQNSHVGTPNWWNSFLYIGFFPTYIFLILAAVFPNWLMITIYGYTPVNDHQSFLSLFFIACMVGQTGHIFAIKARAQKKNYFITRNFILSQFLFHLGLFQCLIYFKLATPMTAGLTIMTSSTVYALLNLRTNRTLT